MKKIFNVVFTLVLFCTSANAVGLEIPTWTKNFFPTNVGEKNRANSGTDYVTPLAEGIQMILSNDGGLNMPASEFFRLKAKELSEESGEIITADDVKKMLANHEYEIMTNAEFEKRFGFKPKNYAIYKLSATIEEEVDFYDPNREVAVLTPKILPGYYSPFIADTCVNYQGGVAYEPTGDNDEDYSLPVQESEGLALDLDVDNSNENDIDINVPASETNEYGTYIENYYEAGQATGGSQMTQDYPYYDDQLYWSAELGWSQCGGFSGGFSLSNSPYGVGGGYNSGYGYNSGFSGYCAQNGVGGYGSTTNNYYYFGDVNSHNNNNSNSGNTTFNWQQWVNNHQNGDDDPPPPPVDDDPLPSNTGGIAGQATTGDNMPGNNAGTTTGKQKEPSGFKKDYKKSKKEGEDVYYANADETKKDQGVKTENQSKSNDKVDGVKTKSDVKTKNEGQSKEQPEFYASDESQTKNQGDERNFEKKSEQVKTQPAEKQFEKKQPVKQNNTASKPKPKVEQKKTNVDENYDRPAKEYQKKKSPEVKKSAPVKKNTEAKKQPVKKSTTVKGSGAKVKPNPSAKKGTGARYEKPTSRKSAGSGQNYKTGNDRTRQSGSQNSKTRNSGSSPSPKRGGRS